MVLLTRATSVSDGGGWVRSLSPRWVALIVNGTRHGTFTSTDSTRCLECRQTQDSAFDMSKCASSRVGAFDVGVARPAARSIRLMDLPIRANIPSGCHGPSSARAATPCGNDPFIRRAVEPASFEVIKLPIPGRGACQDDESARIGVFLDLPSRHGTFLPA